MSPRSGSRAVHYVLAGASGLIGTALREAISEGGDTYTQLVRRPVRADNESTWDPGEGIIDADVVAGADVVVNLAGASIGGKRLTPSYADVVLQSRLDVTGLIARTLAERHSHARLLQGSSIGIYGDGHDQKLSERAPSTGDSLLTGIARKWEAAATPAVNAGVPTVFLRTGLVLARTGGLAQRLKPAVKYGLLKSFGNGKQWMPWVSIEDEVRAILFLAASDYTGPANICGPTPARNEEVIGALGAAAGRPSVFRAPAWAMKLVVGPAADDVLTSQRAEPGVLSRLGFEWTHQTVEDAARWVMAPQ